MQRNFVGFRFSDYFLGKKIMVLILSWISLGIQKMGTKNGFNVSCVSEDSGRAKKGKEQGGGRAARIVGFACKHSLAAPPPPCSFPFFTLTSIFTHTAHSTCSHGNA